MTRRVAFDETDAAGQVHFSRFLVWGEEVEHAFLRACGISVLPEGGGGWPRVRVAADYRGPVRFTDQVVLDLRLEAVGRSSLSWMCEVLVDEEVVAEMSWTCVRVGAAGKAVALSAGERAQLLAEEPLLGSDLSEG